MPIVTTCFCSEETACAAAWLSSHCPAPLNTINSAHLKCHPTVGNRLLMCARQHHLLSGHKAVNGQLAASLHKGMQHVYGTAFEKATAGTQHNNRCTLSGLQVSHEELTVSGGTTNSYLPHNSRFANRKHKSPTVCRSLWNRLTTPAISTHMLLLLLVTGSRVHAGVCVQTTAVVACPLQPLMPCRAPGAVPEGMSPEHHPADHQHDPCMA